MTEETKAPSGSGEVEGALLQPLFSLVELLLHVALAVALPGCGGHSGSRIQWTRTWEVLGVVVLLGERGEVLKTTTATKHHRLIGGNHSGLQSINSFDQLPHVLVEI